MAKKITRRKKIKVRRPKQPKLSELKCPLHGHISEEDVEYVEIIGEDSTGRDLSGHIAFCPCGCEMDYPLKRKN